MTDNELLLRYTEGQRFLFLQEQCLNLIKKALDPIIRKFGLNHSQYVILMILGYADRTGEQVISTEISYLLGREKHTITPLVDSLVRSGYLERGEDPRDRRIISLTITQKGRDLIHKVQPLTYETVADIPLGSPEERATFFRTLEAFRQSFARKSGQDPELFSDAYSRLLVAGERELLKGGEAAPKEE
jgi:DNA-binding MarR family transcriptional regulator